MRWGSGRRRLRAEEMAYVTHGLWTPVFDVRRDQLTAEEPKCFSIVSQAQQTIDFVASTGAMARAWVTGLRMAMHQSDQTADRLSQSRLKSLIAMAGVSCVSLCCVCERDNAM